MTVSVDEKVRALGDIIRQHRIHPRIRSTAMQILRGNGRLGRVPSRNDEAEIKAIYTWVRDNIRYTYDPAWEDVFASPIWTLDAGGGDCDDMVSLLGSLLEAVGHPVQIKVVGYNPKGFSHVYLLARNGTLPLDPTLTSVVGPDVPAGYELPYRMAKVYPVPQ